MKRAALLTLVMLTPLTTYADTPEQVASLKAQEAMKEFGVTLKGTLQAAMKEGGPLSAIPVCHIEAPKIAQQMGAKYGLEIYRTSLKPRARPPTEWETAVLEGFALQKADGKPVGELVWRDVVEVDGKPGLRMMKAIGTEDVCLTCHGTAVKPEVMAKIAELYPDDQATGFNAGDIRGAFSVSVPMASRQ